MRDLAALVDEHSDLGPEVAADLSGLVAAWDLISDLAFSDLVLWVPTWNDAGYVAVAQVRPTTASTAVPDDVVGTFLPRGRDAAIDQAHAHARPALDREGQRPWAPVSLEAVPLVRDHRVVAIIARHPSPVARGGSALEDVYLRAADDLLGMASAGDFPLPERVEEAVESPRVGDGLLRVDTNGRVDYASPNAMSAFRRLGLAIDLVGGNLAELVGRLSHRPLGATVTSVVSGRTAGRVEVEAPSGTVVVRTIPLREGSLVLIRDVSEVRRGQRTVLSREATIREIHHRVKNNLQTVAALLRLQSRRSDLPETRAALAEAQARIGAIAVVHEALSADADSEAEMAVVLQALVQLMRELAPAFGDVPEFQVRCPAIRLPGERLTPLAMCITEVLTNAVEHAHADRIDVEVRREGRALVIRIEDDGVGIADGTPEGLGMSIISTLVESELGGRVSVQGIPGQGTRVEISAQAQGPVG